MLVSNVFFYNINATYWKSVMLYKSSGQKWFLSIFLTETFSQVMLFALDMPRMTLKGKLLYPQVAGRSQHMMQMELKEVRLTFTQNGSWDRFVLLLVPFIVIW